MGSANLKHWLEEEAAAHGEVVEAVVIGRMGWDDYGSEDIPGYADHPRQTVLSWDEAAPMLDYAFSSGYGAPQCEAVWAYTANWVIGISQYDGSTRPFSIPRNPTEGTLPFMPGG